MAWGRLKGIFGAVPKGQHLTGVMDLPEVQMAESSEELYTTVRQVGAGQTAMVYEGVRRADGVHYALKHFTELRGDKEAVRAFRAEVETLRELGSHRFIVSLLEVVRHGQSQSGQWPSSASVPPQGTPGGTGRLDTPRNRPALWAPSHASGARASRLESRRIHRLRPLRSSAHRPPPSW